MKAVLISIQPKWCELIASGKKTIEVRKTKPKLETPFKCYIYCSEKDYDKIFCIDKFMHKVFLDGNGKQKVIGEFVCDRIQEITYTQIYNFGRYRDVCEAETRLDFYALDDYLKQKNGYGWHISDLVIYDEPKELSEFTGLRKTKFGYGPFKITRPPQSWCYVEERKEQE
ncbi:MAG: ASCH domain-containing protein [Clostridia bacterium]|nr:ASCH domain-containing protein [Clostridia bacterium]